MAANKPCFQALRFLVLQLVLFALQPAAARSLREDQSSDPLFWSKKLDNTYLTADELTAWMKEYISRCPARMFSIGQSVQNRTLWVLEISDSPGKVEPKPNFKYVANMHGDETGGRALLPLLAEWLCANYKSNATAARIVQHMHLFILPSMNPDGFAHTQNGNWAPTRENANGYDLNRNFPDPQRLCRPSVAQCNVSVMQHTYAHTQPEVAAIMHWSLPGFLKKRAAASSSTKPPTDPRQYHFTASANLHEGSIVANYPFDGAPLRKNSQQQPGSSSNISASDIVTTTSSAAATAAAGSSDSSSISTSSQAQDGLVMPGSNPGGQEDNGVPRSTVKPPRSVTTEASSAAGSLPPGYNAAPDDTTFRFLARTYATHHAYMATANPDGFPDGITNGAAWYSVYGGIQDWDYLAASCMDITLELSMQKNAAASGLAQMWLDNKEALLALPIAGALAGIRGVVTDSESGAPLPATITITGINWRTFADTWFGFYTRPVAPGRYEIVASFPGYEDGLANVTAPSDLSGVVLDFKLKKL